MSQRELTDSEQEIFMAARRRLAKQRKIPGLRPEWFVIDSALTLGDHLDQVEHSVDAMAVTLAAMLMEAGRSEELLDAIKGVISKRRRPCMVPMDEFCGTILN